MPGTETIVNSAAQQGWAIGTVVFVLVLCIAALTYLVRNWINLAEKQNERLHAAYAKQLELATERETRMATRIDMLEELMTSKLLQVYSDVTVALQKLNDTISTQNRLLEGRLCLMSHAQQIEALRRSVSVEG